jgi:hypothetical protein
MDPFSQEIVRQVYKNKEMTPNADYLMPITATFIALQKKADIVSVFAIIFGIDLSDTKFRAFVAIFEVGSQHIFRKLQIHRYGWIPTTVELQLDGSFKQLGAVLDMSVIMLRSLT